MKNKYKFNNVIYIKQLLSHKFKLLKIIIKIFQFSLYKFDTHKITIIIKAKIAKTEKLWNEQDNNKKKWFSIMGVLYECVGVWCMWRWLPHVNNNNNHNTHQTQNGKTKCNKTA